MKYLFGLLVVLLSVNDLNKIAKVNALKKEAKEAFQNEDFELAASHYRMLVDSFQVEDDNVLLNLASAQYHLNDTVSAYGNYSELTSSSSNVVKSIAEQQLGLMKYNEQKYEEALHHYKQSLKANPANEDSRYNYELLKKLLKEQEEEQKQEQDQEKQDQENKDDKEKQEQDQEEKDQEESEEKKDQEGEENDKEGEPEEEKEKKEGEEKEPQEPEEGEEPKEQPEPSTEEKLKEMNISEEKAKMILEAMKNNEIQYIQQNKRKPTKRRDSKKPDW